MEPNHRPRQKLVARVRDTVSRVQEEEEEDEEDEALSDYQQSDGPEEMEQESDDNEAGLSKYQQSDGPEEMEQDSDDNEAGEQDHADADYTHDEEEAAGQDSDDDEELHKSTTSGRLRTELCRDVDELRNKGELDGFGIRVCTSQPSQGIMMDSDSADVAPVTVQASRVVGVEPATMFPPRCCDNLRCKRPLHEDSTRVGLKISDRTRAGDRDWTPYIGLTLCSRCYNRVTTTGSIEPKARGRKRLASQAGLCSTQDDDDIMDPEDSTWHPPSSSSSARLDEAAHEPQLPKRCTRMSTGQTLMVTSSEAGESDTSAATALGRGSTNVENEYESLKLLSEYDALEVDDDVAVGTSNEDVVEPQVDSDSKLDDVAFSVGVPNVAHRARLTCGAFVSSSGSLPSSASTTNIILDKPQQSQLLSRASHTADLRLGVDTGDRAGGRAPPPACIAAAADLRLGADTAAHAGGQIQTPSGVCAATAGPALEKRVPHTETCCSYKRCMKPLGNPGEPGFQKIFHITNKTQAGNQDWSTLVGQTLCKACYYRFSRHGSLEGNAAGVHLAGGCRSTAVMGVRSSVRRLGRSGGAAERAGEHLPPQAPSQSAEALDPNLNPGRQRREAEPAPLNGVPALVAALKPSSFLEADDQAHCIFTSMSDAQSDDSSDAAASEDDTGPICGDFHGNNDAAAAGSNSLSYIAPLGIKPGVLNAGKQPH